MKPTILRKLARKNKYQLLYARAKDLGNMRLFENTTDFSAIQLLFLNWLEIYNSLYNDLVTNEEYLSEEVIEDDLRTDAYLLYRAEKRKQKQDKKSTKEEIREAVDKDVPSVIFTKKRK